MKSPRRTDHKGPLWRFSCPATRGVSIYLPGCRTAMGRGAQAKPCRESETVANSAKQCEPVLANPRACAFNRAADLFSDRRSG